MSKPVLVIVSSFMISSFACGSSSPTTDPADACNSVGVSLCAKVYACYDADQIAGFGYPATQDECVTQQNASCTGATPEPGFCKGSTQVSASAATACSDELDAQSCTDFETPTSTGACKQGLCAQ